MKEMFRQKSSWMAAAWIGSLAAAAALSPWFFSISAAEMDLSHVLEAPSAAHFFGTDPLGRDVLARILSGGAVSLGVSVSAVLLALWVGTWLGAAAGYFGGWVEKSLLVLIDVMLCFPTFFLILAVVAILGPSAWNVMVILGLTGWMGTARLVRAEVLSLKEREFVLAARALGAGSGRILFRHLIPNALGPVFVNGILGISTAVLTETGLSFLGIGVQPPTPSWGNILTDGKATLGVAWWLSLFPGLVLFLTVLSFNVLGERLAAGLRGEHLPAGQAGRNVP